MAKKYRTYSNEFKRQLVSEIDTGVISVSEAARKNEISRSLVEKWRAKIHEGTLIDRPTTKERQLERELEKAQAKIGQLTLFIDILKKTSRNSQPMKRLNGCVVTGENWASRSRTGAE
jgi:transposase-like protein